MTFSTAAPSSGAPATTRRPPASTAHKHTDPIYEAKRAEYNRKLAENEAEVSKLRARQRAIGDDIHALTTGDAAKGGPKAELRTQLGELRKTRDELEEARAPIQQKLKDTQDAFKRRADELDAAKEKLPFKRIDDVDRKIKDMEKQLESGTLKLIEEKKTVAEISKLMKARKAIEALGAQHGSIDDLDRQAKLYRTALQERDKELARVRDQIKALSAKLGAMDSGRSAHQSRLKGLFAERDALKPKLDALFAARHVAYAEFQQAQAAHREHMDGERLKREQQAKCRDIEHAIGQLERDLKRLDLPPCSDEIAQCDRLLTYFKVDVLKQTPPSEEGKESKELSSAGLAPLTLRKVDKVDASLILKGKAERDADEAALFFGTSKKSAPKPTSAKKHADTGALKLPLWALAGLDAAHLPLVTHMDQVATTIASLEAKKQEYAALQSERLRTVDDQRAEMRVKIDAEKAKLAEAPAKVAAEFALKLQAEAAQREAVKREAVKQDATKQDTKSAAANGVAQPVV